MSEPTTTNAQRKGGYMQINKSLNICAFEDYLEAQLSRLPEIANVEKISSRVIRVLGQNAGKFTLQGTNTYIVGTGRERLIIDTAQGIPEWADLISSTLTDNNTCLSDVLVTHWHGDHMGGVADLVRMYPYLNNSIWKHTPSGSQQPIIDGQIFRVEGATVRAIHAPGHSLDHMCFVLEEENAMFTGDNVLGHGTAAVEQLSTWMSSLRVMQAQGCQIGYPAHGTVIKSLPMKIKQELGAKERRETQILQALSASKEGSGGKRERMTVREIVNKMYGEDLDEEVRQMAIQPFVEEILRKLAEDKKVAFQVRVGQKKWFKI